MRRDLFIRLCLRKPKPMEPDMQKWIGEAKRLTAMGIDKSDIEHKLNEMGADAAVIEAIMAQLKKIQYAKRSSRGVILFFIGAFILVFGFVITFFLFHSGDSMKWAMYGLTTLGTAVLFFGIIDIFGL